MKLTEMSLLELMSIHEAEIKHRKRLLGLDEADIVAIKKCKQFITLEIDELIEHFYERITSFSEMAVIIGDSDTLSRLKLSQRRYVLEIFEGNYGLDYVNNRLRIGLVHKRIGVDPKYYLSSVKSLDDLLSQTIMTNMAGDEAKAAVNAVRKVLNFDTELVISTYIQSLLNEVHLERKKTAAYAAGLEEEIAMRTRELKELSQKDELTGLLNFRALHDHLAKEVARSKRTGAPLSLIYFDVDKFKTINDTMGHKKGDEILAGVAESIKRSIRQVDAGCRYGGDEFCIISPNCTAEDAETICRRLYADFSDKFNDITLSVGIAQADPATLDVPDTLIKEADSLMYKSKKKSGFAITKNTDDKA